MPSVGFVANGVVDETSDDVTPPSVLMEHPPLAVFVNGKFYYITRSILLLSLSSSISCG
jgi:hypothetical protein